MAIPTKSYETIFEEYSAAIDWMQVLGVKISPSRTSHYKKIVEHCKNTYKTASTEEIKKIYPDFVSAMFEIHDFMDIYNAFKNVPPEQLTSIVDKLHKAVRGPRNAADELHSSAAARNFLFEVVVAARANRPDRAMKAILSAKSDSGINFEDKNYWVECKRITSPDKVESNVRKASSQLERILKKQVGTGHRGIVALDVTKIINPKNNIYVSKNDSELLNSVDRLMDKFIKEYSPTWQKVYKRRDKKIVGTIVRLAFMASSEARNILVHTSQWGFNPRLEISKSNDQTLRHLVATLKEAQ